MSEVSFEDAGDHIRFAGVEIGKHPGLITPRIQRSMELGRYEMAEIKLVEQCLRPGDRVLDIGGGLGFLATRLALNEAVDEVLTVEANPSLIEVIRDTFERNGVADRASCLHGAFVKGDKKKEIDFYLRHNFWASSLSGDGKAYDEVVQIPRLDLNAVLAEFRPTLLVCDIEGGEIDLIEQHNIGSLDRVAMEVHPGVYGEAGLAALFAAMGKQGFVMDTRAPRRGDVLSFERAR